MKAHFTGTYPADWLAIAKAVKDAAHWRCLRCGWPNDYATHHVLTVHHLDHDKGNCRWWNLVALCQVCHCKLERTLFIELPSVLKHQAWLSPYLAGFYAAKNLDLQLTRAEVEARLDELLALEAHSVLKCPPLYLDAEQGAR